MDSNCDGKSLSGLAVQKDTALSFRKAQHQAPEQILQTDMFFVESLEVGKGGAEGLQTFRRNAISIVSHLDYQVRVLESNPDAYR